MRLINKPEPAILFSLHQRELKARLADMRPRLYRLAYAWCHDAGLADDLAQETLMKGMKSLHQLQERERLEAWLFRILHNCWRDHFRRLHPQVDIEDYLELPSPDATPEQQHADSELIRRVRNAVADLPLGQRQVVTLVDLEEMSYDATAQTLGIPIGTVMSRLNRARIALRNALQEPASQLRVLPGKRSTP